MDNLNDVLTAYRASGTSSMASPQQVVWNPDDREKRVEFATLMAPLVIALWKRKEPFGGPEALTYMRTLKTVPSVILVGAIDKLLKTETWFPEPAKILDAAADVVVEKRRKARMLWLSDCDHASGFQEREVNGVLRNEPCECRRNLARALAEIGHPIDRPKLKGITEGEGR